MYEWTAMTRYPADQGVLRMSCHAVRSSLASISGSDLTRACRRRAGWLIPVVSNPEHHETLALTSTRASICASPRLGKTRAMEEGHDRPANRVGVVRTHCPWFKNGVPSASERCCHPPFLQSAFVWGAPDTIGTVAMTVAGSA